MDGMDYFQMGKAGLELIMTLGPEVSQMFRRAQMGEQPTAADLAKARIFMETQRALAHAELEPTPDAA